MKRNKNDYLLLKAALALFGIILLSTTAVQLFGQSVQTASSFDLNHDWVEAEITETGEIQQIERRKGGLKSMQINGNEITFKGAMTCGFGSKRLGNVEYNQIDSSLVFSFVKEEGYMNNDTDTIINMVERYKIVKANGTELILRRENEQGELIAFINRSAIRYD